MAFTGTAVVTQISDSIVRITGLSLAAAAAGTIGLFGATGTAPGVTLPESFKTLHYTYAGHNVPFADCIDVSVGFSTVVGQTPPIAVVKTGTTVLDFRATLTNGFASVSSGLEIYVKFHN